MARPRHRCRVGCCRWRSQILGFQGGSASVHRLDTELKQMVATATERGFLTFQQVDQYLPDEGGDPTLIDRVIMALEETGL
ncbi:MAG: RNA polymerase sigma factor region1.1 domain-containing protein, partial [Planctomycetaceae bacterium]